MVDGSWFIVDGSWFMGLGGENQVSGIVSEQLRAGLCQVSS
jgi:hypothetical protein